MNTDMRDRLVELGADPATTLVLSMGANVTAIGGRYVALLDEVRVRKKGETAGLLAPS